MVRESKLWQSKANTFNDFRSHVILSTWHFSNPHNDDYSLGRWRDISLIHSFFLSFFPSFFLSLSLSLSLSLFLSLFLSLSLSLFLSIYLSIYLSLSFFPSFLLSFIHSFLHSFFLSFFPSFFPSFAFLYIFTLPVSEVVTGLKPWTLRWWVTVVLLRCWCLAVLARLGF
jgi:hypothetical protein